MRVIVMVALCTALASCGGWRAPDRGFPWRPFDAVTMGRAGGGPAAPASPTLSSNGHEALNAFRAENGLGPLARSPQLERAARAHASDMARHGYFDHMAPDGGDPMTRAQRAGYSPCFIAENIAQGQGSVPEVMAGWARSPGHRRNMLSTSATEYGLVRGDGNRWVMLLGRSC